MAHITPALRAAGFQPGLLIALLLTGVIGFALGQNWPVTSIALDATAPAPLEDWHGNVMRSRWPN